MSNWNSDIFGNIGIGLFNSDIQTANAMQKLGSDIYGMPAQYAQMDAANNQGQYLNALYNDYKQDKIDEKTYLKNVKMLGVTPFQRASNYLQQDAQDIATRQAMLNYNLQVANQGAGGIAGMLPLLMMMRGK